MDSTLKIVQIDVRKRQKSRADGKDMGVTSVDWVQMREVCGMRVVCGRFAGCGEFAGCGISKG